MKQIQQEIHFVRWPIIGVILLALLFIFGISIVEVRRSAKPEALISQIHETPNRFYGNSLVVNGSVRQVIGSGVFVVSEPTTPSRMLLIISKNDLMPIGGGPPETPLPVSQKVQVRGEIQEFHVADVSSELGQGILDPASLRPWEGQPVLVAENVAKIY